MDKRYVTWHPDTVSAMAKQAKEWLSRRVTSDKENALKYIEIIETELERAQRERAHWLKAYNETLDRLFLMLNKQLACEATIRRFEEVFNGNGPLKNGITPEDLKREHDEGGTR